MKGPPSGGEFRFEEKFPATWGASLAKETLLIGRAVRGQPPIQPPFRSRHRHHHAGRPNGRMRSTTPSGHSIDALLLLLGHSARNLQRSLAPSKAYRNLAWPSGDPAPHAVHRVARDALSLGPPAADSR